MLVVAWENRAGKQLPEGLELRVQHSAIGELQETETAIVRSSNERTDWAFDPGNDDAIHFAAHAGRTAKSSHERLAKSAVRFVSIAQSDVIEIHALTKLIQRVAHPLGPTIGLERHAVMFLKVSANSIRIDAGLLQFGISDACLGITNHSDGTSDPIWWRTVRVHRTASFAWAVTGKQSISRTREIIHISSQRLSRGAGGAAEDPCCADGDEEDSVIRGVLLLICPLHFFDRRYCVHATYCSPTHKVRATGFLTSNSESFDCE